ncbi:MAG: thioesterase family protein [Acidimicrobiales bacterium]
MSDTDDDRSLRTAAGVEPLGPGRYSAHLSPLFSVVDHPHGGYLQCVMASAALAAASDAGARHLHATAVTTNFISAPETGPVELSAEVRRVGRSVSFVHVVMSQKGVIACEALVTLGNLGEDSRARYMDATLPTMAPLEECRQSTGSDEVNIMRVMDLRLDPSSAGWRDGVFSDQGEVRGWLRFDDGGGPWDPFSLHFACDGLPPATFPLGSSGWVPTLQLTSYVRRVPQGEWLRARQWCTVVADGTFDERCELFDERGELVASASQLAMVRFPSGR